MRVSPSVRRGLVICAALSLLLGYITGSREAIDHPDIRWLVIFSVTVASAFWLFGIYGAFLGLVWSIRWLWRKMKTPRGV